MNSHLAAKIREALIPLIIKKTLVVPRATVNESATVTLMSTDIEGILAGIPEIHAVCGSYLDIGVGFYMLSRMREESAPAILLCIIGKYETYSIFGFEC